MNIVKEFKEFAVKGNVIDLAVGVIIGTAFSKIVDSLVKDVIMPPVGFLVQRVDFARLAWELTPATSVVQDTGVQTVVEPVTIRYGLFLNNVLHFLIVAWAVFIVVKQINRLKRTPGKLPPTLRECPRCTTNISAKASRCPNCTSEVDPQANEEAVSATA